MGRSAICAPAKMVAEGYCGELGTGCFDGLHFSWYDEGTRQLYLTFHSGKTYRYFEFPAHQYDEFLAAESRGKYFRTNIRGKFRDEEVREKHRTAS
jgi:hypothetical protein